MSTSTSTPSRGLPRSPAGYLSGGDLTFGDLKEELFARSPSSHSAMSLTTSPLRHPKNLKRRSTTETQSSGLDYYWSSVAGVGPSSSTSSLLAISPSPSAGLLNIPPPSSSPLGIPTSLISASPTSPISRGAAGAHGHGGLQTRSATNLRESATASGSGPGRGLGPGSGRSDNLLSVETMIDRPHSAGSSYSNEPSSSRDAHFSYRSPFAFASSGSDASGASGASVTSEMESPASLSSQYSSHASRSHSYPYDSDDRTNVNPDGRGRFASDAAWERGPRGGGPRGGSAGSSGGSAGAGAGAGAGTGGDAMMPEWRHRHDRFDDIRGSVASGSTARPGSMDMFDDSPWTPVPPPVQERPDLNPPSFSYDSSRRETITASALQVQTTPTGQTRSQAQQHTPNATALGFEESGPGAGAGGPGLGADIGGDIDAGVGLTEPKSAPAWQTEFGVGGATDAEAEDTLKAKQRQTLPPRPRDSPAPTEGLSVRRNAGRGNSPEPPPRSLLRGAPAVDAGISPRTITPDTVPIAPSIPTILHTPHSPDPAPSSSSGSAVAAGRQASADSAMSSHASIAELTDMLGGAIDAIGLIDSRDTPPPTVLVPSKDQDRDKPALASPVDIVERPPKAQAQVQSQLQPQSSESRDAHGPGDSPTPSVVPSPPITVPARKQSLTGPTDATAPPPPPQLTTRSPSIPSIRSIQSVVIAPKPWPQAMMYGHIKTLKTPGERAKAYARAINDLAAAESGLREWCLAATIQAHRPASARASSRKSNFSTIGLRPDGSGPGAGSFASPMVHSLQPHQPPHPHPRNVSASSEFPLREDSYTAREISQRHIDPTDQPTGLPANLPYPQLQQLRGSGAGSVGGGGGIGSGSGIGGIKSSPSMQSVVSTASSKKPGGFFSAMRKGKKDSLSLGPPNTTNKKDVRGLPISSPDTASFPLAPSPVPGSGPGGGLGPGGSSPGSLSGAPPGRLQSSAAPPLGPRGMRMGSFTPPPNVYERASIDVPPRGSFDTSISIGSRMTPPLPARGSFDSTRTKGSLPPPRGSPMGYSTPKIGSPSPGSVTPREEDVRAMADVLPHVEKGVIRAYLARHGEQMQAIGAYLEDEKRGSVMRV